jgi:hypothetical protein
MVYSVGRLRYERLRMTRFLTVLAPAVAANPGLMLLLYSSLRDFCRVEP